jgi:hypothetical protein
MPDAPSRQEPFARWCPAPSLWRRGVAACLFLDLGPLTLLTLGAVEDTPDRLAALGAPWTVLGRFPILAVLSVIALVATVGFARKPGRWLHGVVALAATGTLYMAAARLSDSPADWTLSGGIAVFGWVTGLLAARWLGYRWTDGPAAGRAAERLAGAAALAMLAASYVLGGLGKLDTAGLAWADGTTLRAVIAMFHDIDATGLRHEIQLVFLNSSWLTLAMSVAALVTELGAPALLIGPRARAIWSTLIIGFHLSVFVAAPILFLTPMVLFAILGYPWHRMRSGVAAVPGSEPPSIDHARSRRLVPVGLTLLGVAACSTLVSVFQLSMFVAAPMLFLTPLALLGILGYPWSRSREDMAASPEPELPRVDRRRVTLLAVAVVVAVAVTSAVAWLSAA